MRKMMAVFSVGALVVAGGCRSSSNYQPTVVGTAPVAQPGPAPAPCCNRAPVAAIPAQPGVGTQIPATVPPGAAGYGRY